MEKKRKASVTFSAIALALVVSMAAGLFMQRSGLTPKSYIVFATGSNPDSYGNMIWSVEIWQDQTSGFELITQILYLEYIEGQTVEIDANYPTKLLVRVLINHTLCDDNIDLADDYTRVYWTISGVCTNFEGIYKVTTGKGNDYVVQYWSETWTAATDTTYDVVVEYEAYY